MARTALTVQDVAMTGLVATYTAAATDGHSVNNDGNTILHVKNASDASINVTIATPGSVGGNLIADRVVAVAATTDAFIGPFSPTIYNQPGTSDIDVDYSAITTVTIAALRV